MPTRDSSGAAHRTNLFSPHKTQVGPSTAPPLSGLSDWSRQGPGTQASQSEPFPGTSYQKLGKRVSPSSWVWGEAMHGPGFLTYRAKESKLTQPSNTSLKQNYIMWRRNRKNQKRPNPPNRQNHRLSNLRGCPFKQMEKPERLCKLARHTQKIAGSRQDLSTWLIRDLSHPFPYALNQEPARTSSVNSQYKYFGLCGLYHLCHSDSTLLLLYGCGHRQYVGKWALAVFQ